MLSRPCRKRRPSAREDGGVSGVSSSCGARGSWEIGGETGETVSDFIFLDSKITATSPKALFQGLQASWNQASPEIKELYGEKFMANRE